MLTRFSSCPGRRALAFAFLTLGFGALGGCATSEAHYGRFQGTNSAGEPRSFLLSWQTKRYPGWAFMDDVATPVRLQTQCSSREWLLRDPSTAVSANAGTEASADACDAGPDKAAVRACGQVGLDLDRQGRPLASADHQCLALTDADGSQSILELGRDLELLVSCYPVETEHREGDELVNTDYLKASVVPYSIRIRTAPLYSMNQRPPALDDSVCEKE